MMSKLVIANKGDEQMMKQSKILADLQ